MDDTLPSNYSARTHNRLRLFIGSDRIRNSQTAGANQEHEIPVSRQIDALLSGIVGNARLLKLDAPDLPDPVSRRIDAIVESARKITALLNRSDNEPSAAGNPGRDDYRK